MLKERIRDPWLKFLVTDEDPLGTFYYVVGHYGAFSHQKLKMLTTIVERHPAVKVQLEEKGGLYHEFGLLAERLAERNEILSPAEMEWISVYVKSEVYRTGMEELIYEYLLSSSAHWDKMRQNYRWSLSNEARKEIASRVLEGRGLTSVVVNTSAKRMLQIAQEFGLPDNGYAELYFQRLIWDRHYEKAESLRLDDVDDVVFEVIVDNLNAQRVRDAVEVAKRFLPHCEDVLQELEEIRQVVG